MGGYTDVLPELQEREREDRERTGEPGEHGDQQYEDEEEGARDHLVAVDRMGMVDHQRGTVGIVLYPEGAAEDWTEEEVRVKDDDADGEPHCV